MIEKFVEWSKRNYTIRQKILRFVPAGIFFLIGIPSASVYVSLFDSKLGLQKFISEPQNYVLSLPLIFLGLALSFWSVFVQLRVGKGTPVPLAPTQRLITTGPYSLCRNPMALGVMIYYFGISLWLGSLTALALSVLVLILAIAYIKMVEEKELEARFGDGIGSTRVRLHF